jgi:preprotein translocase subunit SecB
MAITVEDCNWVTCAPVYGFFILIMISENEVNVCNGVYSCNVLFPNHIQSVGDVEILFGEIYFMLNQIEIME